MKFLQRIRLERAVIKQGRTPVSMNYDQEASLFHLRILGSWWALIFWWWELTKLLFFSRKKRITFTAVQRRGLYDPTKMTIGVIDRKEPS